MNNKKDNYIKTFLTGFAMGTCDAVPGISGGTIAFISGIYEKFIHSIKNLTTKKSYEMLLSLLKLDFKNFKKKFFELNIDFLSALLIGLFTALIIVSKLILFLLENYRSYTLAFFTGLIITSTLLIKKEIKINNKKSYILTLMGILTGIFLAFININSPQNISNLYIIFGGFLAVSAMFLPGISGSFILYLIGLYEFVYGALHNITTEYKIIAYFSIGIILGAIFISRLIDFLFKNYKNNTLSLLFGLVIGALSIPIKDIYLSTHFTPLSILLIILYLLFGLMIVKIISAINQKLGK